MFARSFRLVRSDPGSAPATRLVPPGNRRKQTLAAASLAALVVLAGCGGGGSKAAPPQRVSGPGYRFAAPPGWTVKRSRLTVRAARGPEFVAVSTFPLLKTYRPALFAPVEAELRTRMDNIAKSMGGTVDSTGTAVVSGVRSHVYRVSASSHVDEYTFVLVGLREYQLVCRADSADAPPCEQLQTSFALSS
jgi:hypothetical protein